MIEGVYKIGKILPKRDFLEEFIEDIGDKNKHVFKIVIDISGEYPEYRGVEYEEFNSGKKMKYFYKRGASTTPDKTPTSKITEIDKTFNTKVKKTFLNFLNSNANNLDDEEKMFLKKMQSLIEKEIDNIKKDLKEKARQIGVLKGDSKIEDNGVITFVFKDGSGEKYIGEMDVFKNPFLKNENEAYKGFYHKFNKTSKGENKYCYICKREADEVWGFVNTYNFYTADKECYIAGGFKQELMWRNYPVCSSCAKVLERGKRYIDENLNFNFCGFNYMIIPELIIPDEELTKRVLNQLKEYQRIFLGEKRGTVSERKEELLLRILSKEKNQINFNFLFYEKSNSAFKILLLLKEIAPTRLKYLMDAKDRVDNLERKYNVFEEIKTKKEVYDFNFSFNFIREFFPNNKVDGRFDKYFLAILNNIFIDKKISFEFLLKRVMEKIRHVFLSDHPFINPLVLKSYKIVVYLEEIKILDRRIGDMKNYGNNYQEFFKENPLLDDDVKRGLFLEGVLAQKLLNIQFQERNSTPFKSRLNGLKIDEKVAKRLLPEIINKLEEYNKNYYRELEKAIGQYFIKSDFGKYSVDEMSYYFTLGMVLEKHFSVNQEENPENDN